jgi:DNA-binding transcriptional ArsR family regulator
MDAVDRVGFILSPFLETFWSLHVLQQPERHPLNQNMVRDARRETRDLRHDLRRFGFAYRGAPTALGLPIDGVAEGSWSDELERARHADDAQAVRFFVRSFYLGAEPIDRDGRVPAPVAERLLAYTRAVHASVDLAERALREPRAVLAEFLDLVERYWLLSFESRWTKWYLADLRREVDQGKVRIATSLADLLRRLPVEVRLDPAGSGFSVDRLHDHDLPIGPRDRIVLTPSNMAWPHVRVSCERPGILGLAVPRLLKLDDLASVPPPDALLNTLEALADDTRLRVLRFLFEVPRSTQELATLVNVTVSTMSEHLRKLEGAGVVQHRRDGHYVVYEPSLDAAELLDELRSYLDQSVDRT